MARARWTKCVTLWAAATSSEVTGITSGATGTARRTASAALEPGTIPTEDPGPGQTPTEAPGPTPTGTERLGESLHWPPMDPANMDLIDNNKIEINEG